MCDKRWSDYARDNYLKGSTYVPLNSGFIMSTFEFDICKYSVNAQ